MSSSRFLSRCSRSLHSLAVWVKEIHRRRHRYRLTLEGVLFIGVTFAIGLAAFNTGANLLYLICAMLLSFLMVSGVASTNSLRGLQVSRSAPRNAVAGTPCRVQITLHNNKRWYASYSLRVIDRLDDKSLLGAAHFLTVPSKSIQHASYRTIFPIRGLYKFGSLTVSSRFPFGLMERSWTRPIPQDILVYPRLVEVRPILMQAEVDLGEVESGKKGPGTSLYQLRSYSAQDSARDIHWKTSARMGRLMVMEFEKEEKRRVSIYLNNVAPPNADEHLRNQFERAIVLAGSLAKHFLESDHQVQLVTVSGKVPFGAGVSHLHRCLRALASIEWLDSEDHPFTLPPPEAESANLFIHYDPSRRDAVYSASATVLDVQRWQDYLNPAADNAV